MNATAPGAPFCSLAPKTFWPLRVPRPTRTDSSTVPAVSGVGAMLRTVTSLTLRASSKRAPTSVRKTLPANTSKRRRLSSPLALVATTSSRCFPSLRPSVFQDYESFARARAVDRQVVDEELDLAHAAAPRLSRASTSSVIVSATC